MFFYALKRNPTANTRRNVGGADTEYARRKMSVDIKMFVFVAESRPTNFLTLSRALMFFTPLWKNTLT